MEDLVYLGAGVVSSLSIMVYAFRQRHRVGEAGSEALVRVSGLRPLEPSGSVYKVRLGDYVDSLSGGWWECARVGKGGWGLVYRCGRGGMVYAVKVPYGYEYVIEGNGSSSGLPTMHEGLARRIREEARMLEALRHVNVIRLVGYSTFAPLLVYEYADQGSVEYQLSSGWRPGLRDALVVALHAANGLRYIHSRGLVHGDIKAGNILLAGGIAKIGDFSTLTSLLMTVSKSRMGYTPGWRAPEQIYQDLMEKSTREGYENRIDVYQLGNLILYLLTGETIDGSKRVKEEYARDRVSRIRSREVRELVWEMLSLNPWDRPTADEVARRLNQIIQHL